MKKEIEMIDCDNCIHNKVCSRALRRTVMFADRCPFREEKRPEVAYLCKYHRDERDCKHTTRIEDAKNFEKLADGKYIEKVRPEDI